MIGNFPSFILSQPPTPIAQPQKKNWKLNEFNIFSWSSSQVPLLVDLFQMTIWSLESHLSLMPPVIIEHKLGLGTHKETGIFHF